MPSRPSKLEVAMQVAKVTAQLSHDLETQVGSVLVKTDSMTVISTGYNGFVKGAPDDKLPRTRPEKYQYIIHSEINLLLNCVRDGIATKDCIVVCTLSPCMHCMRFLYQAGIRKVVCADKYRDFDSLMIMEDIRIIQSTTPEGFIELTYEAYS